MKHKLFLLLTMVPMLTMCQPISIRGKIINEQNEPIPAASVTLKRTGRATLSDEKGNFTIHDSRLNDTLIISAAGYEIQETPNNERGLITIILKRKITSLANVTVNTGYEQLSPTKATGSFDIVNENDLNRQLNPNIIDRLDGLSNSVLFDRHSNRPPFTVRGFSSINGPKAPLIILDNFPYEGEISNINPNDIESITILKDAAAASIWGTRAGNGVIVITSKKGKLNRPLQFSFNSSVSVGEKPDLFQLPRMSPEEFIGVETFLFEKGYYNSMLNNAARPAMTPAVEILVKKANGQITAAEADLQLQQLANYDLRSQLMQQVYRPSLHQQNALSASGGSHQFAFNVSAGYDKNTDELSQDYNRYSGNIQLLFRPIAKLQITTSLIVTEVKTTSGKSSLNTVLVNGRSIYPYARLADDNGNALPLYLYRQTYLDTAGAGKLLDWKYYPLEDYKHNRNNTSSNHLLAAIGLRYDLLPGFSVDLKYQYEKQNSVFENLQDQDSYAARDAINRFSQINRTTGVVKYNVPLGGILDKSLALLTSSNLRFAINYNKTIGKHQLSSLAGAEQREVLTTSNAWRLYGYNDEFATVGKIDLVNSYPTLPSGNAIIPSNNSAGEAVKRFVSAFANAAYTYDFKYTFTISARKDASNLFGVNANDKGVPLWSAGAAWKISDESFYQVKFLPTLRLRATYGFSGNVDMSKSAVTTITIFPPGLYTPYNYANVSQYPNPDLQWERVKTINLAADFATIKSRLSGSVEYYIKHGLDLFGPSPMDYTTGVGNTITRNIANMKGTGVDISLNMNWFTRKFQWTQNLNFNYNKSIVTDYLFTPRPANAYVNSGSTITAVEGRPIYSVVSYPWGGLSASGQPQGYLNDEISTSFNQLTGSDTKLDDLIFHGPAIAPFFGNLLNSFGWNSFTLDFNISFRFGHYFRRSSIDYANLFGSHQTHSDFSLRWQKPGDELITHVPAMIYPLNNNRESFYRASEVHISKAGLIRLHFINLGYEISKQLWKKNPFDRFQLYLNAANLGLLWRANDNDLDPDYPETLPPSRNLSFGIRTHF